MGPTNGSDDSGNSACLVYPPFQHKTCLVESRGMLITSHEACMLVTEYCTFALSHFSTTDEFAPGKESYLDA